LTQRGFAHIIPDASGRDPAQVKRVLLCTGKVYYDLEAARRKHGADQVAILRIEQLYPLHRDELLSVLANYKEGTPVVWGQQEPRNRGHTNNRNVHLQPLLREYSRWVCISRPLSASPATGSAARHKHEQNRLIEDALDLGE